MSSFTGGKVKEPKVRSYIRPLHVDMQSYQTSGLSDGLSSRSVGNRDDTMITRTKRSSSATQFPSHHHVSPASHRTGIKQSRSDSMGMSLKNSYPTRTVHVTSSGKSVSDNVGRKYHTSLPQSQSWQGATNGTEYSQLLTSSIYRGPSPNTRDVPTYSSYREPSLSTRDVTTDPSYSSSQSSFRSTDLRNKMSSVKGPTTSTNTLDENVLRPTVKPMIRKTRSASAWTDTHSRKDPALHLPQETISSLQETIKRQKKEFSDLKGKMNRKIAQMPTVSRHSNEPSQSRVSGEAPLPVKKRKVATAPPPKTYVGFTSTVHEAPPLKTGLRHASSITSNTRSSSIDMSEHMHTKVPHPPTITPYTWRSGQETVNKVLNRKRSGTRLSDRRQQPRLPSSTLDQLTALNNSRTDALLLLHDLEKKGSNNEEEENDSEIEDEQLDEEIHLEKKQQTKGYSPVAVKLRKMLENNSTEEIEESPKVIERHYDREAVRKYMKSKEEEKRRKKKEEKDTQEKAQNERERRLKDLQERQRQIVVGNLMHQKRQHHQQYQQHQQDRTGYSHFLDYSSDEDESIVHIGTSPPPLHATPPPSSLYTVPSRSPPAPPINTLSSTLPQTSVGVSPSPHTPVSSVSSFATPPRKVSPRVNLSFTTPPLSATATHVLSQTLPMAPPTTATSLFSPYTVNSTHLNVPPPYSSKGVLTPSPPVSRSRSPSRTPPVGSPIRTPSADHRQARILALKQSALALREKIQAQRKVMNTHQQGMCLSPRATPTLPQEVQQLPGVNSIYQHAAIVREQLKENLAATKIQSVWKGYKQRKYTRPSVASHPPIESLQAPPFIQVSPPIITAPVSQPSRAYTPIRPIPITKTATPPSHIASPWLQPGGDPMSVVNIYARKQEELKKLLDNRPVFDPVVVTSSGGVSFDKPINVVSSLSSSCSNGNEDESVKELLPVSTNEISNSGGFDNEGKDEIDENGTPTSSRSSSPEISAITPPGGSPSYDESSFTTPPLYQPSPPTSLPHTSVPGTQVPSQQPRYSPHALQMKLLTELNVLEAVEEGIGHLEGVETTKAVAEAKQETVTLAQLLKTQRQTHSADVDTVTSKAKKESEIAQREFQKLSEEANRMSARMQQMEEQSKVKDEKHTHELQKVKAVTCQKVDDVKQQLLNVQSSMSSAILDANEKQFQSAHDMAVGVAKAAAEGAVQAALKKQKQSTPTLSYQSDFEDMTSVKPDNSSLTLTPTHNTSGGVSSAPPISTPTSTFNTTSILLKLSPQLSGGESTRSQSLTPVPSEKNDEDGDKTVTELDTSDDNKEEGEDTIGEDTILTEDSIELSGGTTDEVTEDFSHDFEDDVSDTSFRELLPSISHQRQHIMKGRKTPPVSESEQPLTSSHEVHSGDHSPSSVIGEESFFDFTSRMFNQYAKEEEMRAKHKLALLELRGKAIQEKSDAELKWLTIKKGQVQKRGDDLAMPSLLKREKGILKKLKHEQAEIQRLKEVHRAAIRERKMLLLQQQDIARIHHSASYYKDKIRKYGAQQHSSREPSPYTDLSLSPSPSPSISLSQEDIREQFSSHNTSPSKSLSHSTTSIPDLIGQSTETNQTVPILKSMPGIVSDSDSMKLRHKSAQEAEWLLNKRCEELIKKRKKAENLLRSEEELLKRKKELDEEEDKINQILEQAKRYHKQMETKGTAPPTTTGDPSRSSISPAPPTTRDSPRSSNITTHESSIATPITDILIPPPEEIHNSVSHTTAVEYGLSSFESQVGVSVTPTATSTPRSSNGTLDYIEELTQQLKVKELELQEKKLKNQQTLDLVQAGQIDDERVITSDITLRSTSIPTGLNVVGLEDKPETTPIHETTPVHETTPIEEVLSPVSSGSSVSTVVSLNVGEDKDQHSSVLTEDKSAPPFTTVRDNDIKIEEGGASLPSDSSVPEVTESLNETLSTTTSSSSLLSEDKRQQLVLTNDDVTTPVAMPLQRSLESSSSSHVVIVGDITMDARVMVGNKLEGTVRYIGETEFEQGVWVGIELDYEDGKNDGSVNGKRYFQCSPGYGIFAPPNIIRPVAMSEMYSDSSEGSHSDIRESITEEEGYSKDETSISDQRSENIEDEGHSKEETELMSSSHQSKKDGKGSAKSIVTVERNVDISVDEIAEGLLQQLTGEAFDTVNALKKAKDNVSSMSTDYSIEESAKEREAPKRSEDQKATDNNKLVDEITNDLLKVLVSSEVNVVCNIHSAKTTDEENDDNAVNEVVSRPPPSTEDFIRQKSGSFSSETLSLVASSKDAINAITHAAWTALMKDGDSISRRGTAAAWHRPPPEVVMAHCTMTPGPMLDCQESFINLVYQLAVEVINKSNESCKNNLMTNLASYYKPKEHSLQVIQQEVFKTIQECKRPVVLPPTRILNNNCRPCGKPVDTVDMLLIKELRDEEPSWVDYEKDREEVKNRTTDEILMLLIEETASVIGSIYQKKNPQ